MQRYQLPPPYALLVQAVGYRRQLSSKFGARVISFFLVSALLAAPDTEGVDRILLSRPGIGPWTSAETRIKAFGDPDAVSVGDYHLAHEVGYALTGSRTDDDGMLELLSPWAGHRQRVIRLLGAGGPREPRRGARLHPEDHRFR